MIATAIISPRLPAVRSFRTLTRIYTRVQSFDEHRLSAEVHAVSRYAHYPPYCPIPENSCSLALQVNSALHPSGIAKSSTSFGWGKGGKVTSPGWQVTLCDLIWHVISRSGVVISITNCYIRFTLLTYRNLWTDCCN